MRFSKDLPLKVYCGEFYQESEQKKLPKFLIKNLLSYFIGVQLSRYKMHKDGLSLAKYSWSTGKTNIYLELTSKLTGHNIYNRLEVFLQKYLNKKDVAADLDFIGNKLYDDTRSSQSKIQQYFLEEFYKDHLKKYQNKPIYLAIQSGPRNTLSFLFALHRSNKDMFKTELLDKVIEALTKVRNLKQNESSSLKQVFWDAEENEVLALLTKVSNFVRNLPDDFRINIDDGFTINYEKLNEILVAI